MSTRYSAYGTQLQLGDAGTPTEAFNTIAGVMDITGPGFATDTIDATGHDSSDNGEEVVAGILRWGEVTFDIAYDPDDSTHDDSTGIYAAWLDRAKHNFQLVMVDATPITASFTGYVTAFEPSFPVNGLMTASITIKLTGKWTLA